MRFLILSDIHSNWEALQAVLADAEGRFDTVVCCGDVVGYNPNPSEVIAWTRQNCSQIVRGNHDKAVAGLADLNWFNEVAQVATIWTQHRLSPDEIAYLNELPQGPLQLERFAIFHGASFDEDEYVVTKDLADDCFRYIAGSLAFFGHSHVQGGFFKRRQVGVIKGVPAKQSDAVIELSPDTFYLINPGSVGQPRDRNPRAAYAIYNADLNYVEFRRVEYDIERTAAKIRAQGLPNVLWKRLFEGF